MIDVRIIGKDGTAANVGQLGGLSVVPPNFNETKANELGTADAGVTFYLPLSGKQFIITGVYASGDRDISNTVDATVNVYESLAEDSATIEKSLLQFALARSTFQAYENLNLIVNSNRYITAKTSDDDVFMNILGFYIPILK